MDILTNECQLRIASGLMVWPSGTVVATLYTSSASFDASSSAYSATNELPTGSGYTRKSLAVSGRAISLVGNEVMYDCDNLIWTGAGGAIGPARYCAFVDTTLNADKYLYIVDFGTDKTADDTTDFKITIDVSGLFRTRVA